jgi:hypothetical protein
MGGGEGEDRCAHAGEGAVAKEGGLLVEAHEDHDVVACGWRAAVRECGKCVLHSVEPEDMCTEYDLLLIEERSPEAGNRFNPRPDRGRFIMYDSGPHSRNTI